MTGRYAIRSGNGVAPLGSGVYGLVQWEVTLAEMFSGAGYNTGMFGKWQLGHTSGRFPTDQGFDEWYGIPSSTDKSVYSQLEGFVDSGVEETYVIESRKRKEPEKIKPYCLEYRPFIDNDLTEKAIDFYPTPIPEWQAILSISSIHGHTLPFSSSSRLCRQNRYGNWADLLLQIDTYNGRLLDTIEDLGIRDNTIFIFTADNGPEALPFGDSNVTVEMPNPGSAGPW